MSCYVRTGLEYSADQVRALYAEFYAGEPFIELTDASPGVRDVRETNLARIHATVEETQRARARLLRDRQPLEGRGVAGDPGPEPRARDRRDGGAPVTFFRSRWIDKPAHVTELSPIGAARRLPRGGRRGGDQGRHARRRRARVRLAGDGVGGALLLERAARRAGRRLVRGARRRAAGDRRELRQRERRGRRARAGHGARRSGRGGRGARRPRRPGRQRGHRRDRPRAPAREAARRHRRGRRPAGRRRRQVRARDHDHGPLAEGGLPRGDAAVGHGPAGRAGEGRRDDLAEVRDDVLLRRDRRGAWRRRRSTC